MRLFLAILTATHRVSLPAPATVFTVACPQLGYLNLVFLEPLAFATLKMSSSHRIPSDMHQLYSHLTLARHQQSSQHGRNTSRHPSLRTVSIPFSQWVQRNISNPPVLKSSNGSPPAEHTQIRMEPKKRRQAGRRN
jgi:hypothetical protein